MHPSEFVSQTRIEPPKQTVIMQTPSDITNSILWEWPRYTTLLVFSLSISSSGRPRILSLKGQKQSIQSNDAIPPMVINNDVRTKNS